MSQRFTLNTIFRVLTEKRGFNCGNSGHVCEKDSRLAEVGGVTADQREKNAILPPTAKKYCEAPCHSIDRQPHTHTLHQLPISCLAGASLKIIRAGGLKDVSSTQLVKFKKHGVQTKSDKNVCKNLKSTDTITFNHESRTHCSHDLTK